MSDRKTLISDDCRATAAVFRAFALETIDAGLSAELSQLAEWIENQAQFHANRCGSLTGRRRDWRIEPAQFRFV